MHKPPILILALIQVHAENGDIIAENQRRLLARGVTGPEGHPAAQPQEVEEEAVRQKAIFINILIIITTKAILIYLHHHPCHHHFQVRRACSLALSANVPLIISAPSSPDVVAVIAEYQARGLTVLGEAHGAALALDGSHYFNQCWSHAAAFVASPPLREGENVPEELVNALKVSTVNLIITILSFHQDGEGLDLVGSGHTGILQAQRAVGQDNFTAIPQV